MWEICSKTQYKIYMSNILNAIWIIYGLLLQPGIFEIGAETFIGKRYFFEMLNFIKF